MNEFTYNQPSVSFDKTKWTIKSEASFRGLINILELLFRPLELPDITTSSAHKQIRIYEKNINKILVYYYPISPLHPDVRVVFPENDSESLKILQEKLINNNFIVSLTKTLNSLNINYPDDTKVLPSDDIKLRIKKSFLQSQLLDCLFLLLTTEGYELLHTSKVKNSEGPTYNKLSVFETEYFRINISFSPNNSFLPFSSVQIDGFKKQNKHYPYYILLFILRILKLYEIDGPRDSQTVTVKPSQLELAFDFYNHQSDLLLKLSSTIYSTKKHFGFCSEPNSPMKSYDQTDRDILLKASHYLGKRDDNNYQIAVYNRPEGCTRLEFRLKNKGLSDLKIRSIDDIFSTNWINSLLHNKKIKFLLPNKEAFKRIPSSQHYLADISLKALISKVPGTKKSNLMRKCFDENNNLKESLEQSSSIFYKYINVLYNTSSLMIITTPAMDELIYGPNDKIYPIDLLQLFRNIPPDSTTETYEHEKFIRFTISDNEGQLLVKILIGEIPERFLEYQDTYVIEKFCDIFRKENKESFYE